MKGLRSRDQWIQAILLVKSFKLAPRPFDEGPRPKSGKLSEAKPTWHLFWRENQLVWIKKHSAKKESLQFGEPRIRLGTKVQSNLRIQFASNQSKLVPRKLDMDPRLKWALMNTDTRSLPLVFFSLPYLGAFFLAFPDRKQNCWVPLQFHPPPILTPILLGVSVLNL